MSEKARQFRKVFDHVYHQWLNVPGYEPPLDDEPLTEEEMYLAADISNDCEELFYQITDEQNKK